MRYYATGPRPRRSRRRRGTPCLGTAVAEKQTNSELERYSLPEMARVWSLDTKYEKWLEVEVAVAEAWAEEGRVPREALPAIRRGRVNRERMDEVFAQTKHDVTAFLRAVGETIGPEARFVHLGMTSNDVIDTALCLQIKEASAILLRDVDALLAVLESLALKHKDTLQAGRTHGVHAEPITFGFKVAVWVDEFRRNRHRLVEAAEQIAYGKISGAVGTHANLPPSIEEAACAALGLKVAPVSTQVLQRDRHAFYMTTLAVIAASLEKVATEIRGLQRTEVHEVEEPFAEGQTGSSAMPHKRNPELSERICGLSRVIRGNAVTALENVALWHERDISNSSAERLILPESCLVLDYILRLAAEVLGGLRVFPERMRRNLDASYGLVYSQRVLLALVDKGLSRTRAYELVQRNAMETWRTERQFVELLKADPDVSAAIDEADLEALFDNAFYTQYVDEAFRRLGLLGPGGQGSTKKQGE